MSLHPRTATRTTACKARIDAENAKGGVNGRKINVEYIDDKSGGGNLTAAQDLVQNRNVFAVVDNSAFAFLTWRYLKDQAVPMRRGRFYGSILRRRQQEHRLGSRQRSPVPGLTYDTTTKVMKQMGAKKVAAIGYGACRRRASRPRPPRPTRAEAQGLDGVYLNNTLEFGGTDVGPIVLGIKNSGADGLYLPLDSDTNFAIGRACSRTESR